MRKSKELEELRQYVIGLIAFADPKSVRERQALTYVLNKIDKEIETMLFGNKQQEGEKPSLKLIVVTTLKLAAEIPGLIKSAVFPRLWR